MILPVFCRVVRFKEDKRIWKNLYKSKLHKTVGSDRHSRAVHSSGTDMSSSGHGLDAVCLPNDQVLKALSPVW